MSLLHATWLRNKENWSDPSCPELFLWADTWKVAKPAKFQLEPSSHPYTLSSKELRNWLSNKHLLPANTVDQSASLTLPTKSLQEKRNTENHSSNQKKWSCLPLQAEEQITNTYEWWPWKIEGLTLNSFMIFIKSENDFDVLFAISFSYIINIRFSTKHLQNQHQ